MRKGMRNIVIFAPLKSKSFKVSAAGHGVIGRSSKWADGEIIKKAFQGAPMGVTSMIGFHNPKFCGTVSQRVRDLPEFNCVNNFVMGNGSSFTRDISVGHRVSLFIRRGCHGQNGQELTESKCGH